MERQNEVHQGAMAWLLSEIREVLPDGRGVAALPGSTVSPGTYTDGAGSWACWCVGDEARVALCAGAVSALLSSLVQIANMVLSA